MQLSSIHHQNTLSMLKKIGITATSTDTITGVARNFDWEGSKIKTFYAISLVRFSCRDNDDVTKMTS